MSSENPSTATFAETNAVDARVVAVERQVESLQAALSTSRRSRQTLLLGFIALIAIVSFLFYPMVTRLQSEEYITELSNEAQSYLADNSDNYMREVQTLSDNVTPVITKAFYEQAKKDTPKFTLAMNREREVLMRNLERRLKEQINAHYERVLAEYESIIVQEFPQAEDEQIRRRVIANFREALNRMVQRFYADELRAELQAMYDTWDGFPIADPAEEGDPKLEDQLVGYLMELVTVKMSGREQLVVAAEPAYDDRAAPAPAPSESDASDAASESESGASTPEPPPTPEEAPKEASDADAADSADSSSEKSE